MSSRGSALSVFLLVLSLIVFAAASAFFYKSYQNKDLLAEKTEVENKLKDSLDEANKQLDEVSEQLKTSEDEKKKALELFSQKFGYDYDADKKEIINEEIKRINDENKELLDQIKAVILENKACYSGDYFQSIDIKKPFDELSKLSQGILPEKLDKNLSTKLGLSSGYEKLISNGSLGKLLSANSDKKDLVKILGICVINFGKSLNEVASDLSDVGSNVENLSRDFCETYAIYKLASEYGINLGDISLDRLENSKNEILKLRSAYLKNKAIINFLEDFKNEE